MSPPEIKRSSSKALFSSDDRGYLFRAINHQGHISVDKPLLSPAVDSRLRKYTRNANIDSGETLPVFVPAVPLLWLSPVPLWLTLCLTLAGQFPKQLLITSS